MTTCFQCKAPLHPDEARQLSVRADDGTLRDEAYCHVCARAVCEAGVAQPAAAGAAQSEISEPAWYRILLDS